MTEMELYKLWCQNATEDEDLVRELKEIASDEEAIKDRIRYGRTQRRYRSRCLQT